MMIRSGARCLLLAGFFAFAGCGSGGSSPPQLTSISVEPAAPRIAAGTTQQFTATGIYSDGSKQDVSATAAWESSNTNAATVASGGAAAAAGLATAISPATTTITAALDGVSGSTNLTVTAATLVSIGVSPANLSEPVGLTHQLAATGVYTDHSTHDVTTAVTWSAAQTAVATVGDAPGSVGLLTAVSPGSTAVTAAVGAVSGSITVTVTPAVVESIGVTPATLTLAKGLSHAFKATGIYSDHSTHDLTAAAQWTSSLAAVATIGDAPGSAGVATATGTGSATLTAAYGGMSGTAVLTATAAALVSVAVTPANPTLVDGLHQAFTAMGTYSDASLHDLTDTAIWSSTVETVAVVANAPGAAGLATSVAPGATTIGATASGLTGSTTLTVTPATLVSIAVTPAGSTITLGTNQQFTATGTYSGTATQNLTSTVTWQSSNAAVAPVSNAAGTQGLATAAGAGSATMTAMLGGLSGSAVLQVIPDMPVSITVTPANPRIANATEQQFAAIGQYAGGSTQDLTAFATWTSSVPGTASVSNAAGSIGLAAALALGTTSIGATFAGVSGSTTLTITAATLTSIALTPVNAHIPDGGTDQFTATGTFSDASTQDITLAVNWSSADSAVASVSNAAGSQGLVTGAALGSTTLGASFDGVLAPAVPLSVVVPTYAYVVDNGDNTVSQYAIAADGDLSALTPATAPTGNGPVAVAVSPAGPYLFVANNLDNTVSAYTIAAGGALTPVGGVPPATGAGPVSAVVDPSGQYLYVANYDDGTLSQFAVGAGGALTALSPAAVATGAYPQAIAVEPTGHYVYVAAASGSVSEYAIGAGGGLTALTPATVIAGTFPQAIVAAPTGHHVYVVNSGDDTVSQYAIGTGGVLAALNPATVPAGGSPESIAIDPAGRYAYEADAAGTVSQYAIGAGGLLQPMTPASVLAQATPQAVSVDPSGSFVYVANEGDDLVSQYGIGGAGALTPLASNTLPTGSTPLAIAVASR